jgi:Ca2+/Na+ antiporter
MFESWMGYVSMWVGVVIVVLYILYLRFRFERYLLDLNLDIGI